MAVLEGVHDPSDLRAMTPAQLEQLAAEIRAFLIRSVCSTGGHLGSNLGVVELTIAVHRVFDSPATPIVFDTGHQTYVHKLLTGRQAAFLSLRSAGGLSGYPRQDESVHDLVENSHASTAISYADGLSRAVAAHGGCEVVVAVVGDGSLTGGLAWEALNNLGASRRPVVLVLNDNGRSYAPTVGGLPAHLERLHDRLGFEALVEGLGGAGSSAGLPSTPAGAGVSVFQAAGLDYVGPVDGHDIGAMEAALREAAGRRRPVVVHCRTRKGLGYCPAEQDEADRLHSVGPVEVATGHPAHAPSVTWTDVFGAALTALGERREDVVAVSAAMVGPTGMGEFARRFPGRCVDTGIAEQHAVTCASGMAMGGLHPVVAIYATFASRAFDQTLLDVAMHRLPVTFVLDRAGVTGPDGPSHHGLWDLGLFGLVPGMRVAAPRDPATLAEELEEAVDHAGGPTALRFPKASAGEALPAVERWRGLDLLRRPAGRDALLVAVGPMASVAIEAADALAAEGIRCMVVDPRWVLPVNRALVDLAGRHRLVVTVEDGVRVGGFGSRLAQCLADEGVGTPVRVLGLTTGFLAQGERGQILHEHGLDAQGMAAQVRRGLGCWSTTERLPGPAAGTRVAAVARSPR